MYVGGAEAEFAGTGFQDNVRGGVGFLELLGDGKGAVWGGIIDNNYFVIEGTGRISVSRRTSRNKTWRDAGQYFSVKVLLRSQIMIGRLRRSL